MEFTLSPTKTARCYALQLSLRPVQPGTLMPFNGELVHGAFLRWLQAAAPDLAAWLHEGQKRRLFTCSSLRFSQQPQAHLRAERENIHLPLDPRQTYPIRLTFLMGELFPLFHEALTHLRQDDLGADAPHFLQIAKQLFLLEEIILADDASTGWTGYTSLTHLVEQARQRRFPREALLTLEFASLTSFSRGHKKFGYGPHSVMLPLPQLVFANLARRWADIASPELVDLVQAERIEHYLQEDGAIIVDYNLKAHHVHFTTHRHQGFVGTCTYVLRGPDEPTSAETPLTIRQQLAFLASLAFYTGIGYKTAMGLGQARVRFG